MYFVYKIFRVNQEVYEFHNLLNISHNTNTSVPRDSYSASLLLSNFQRHFVIIYVLLMASLIISGIIRSALFVKMTTRASINLHNQMFNSVIRTTMFFFNENSTGNFFGITYVLYILFHKIYYSVILCRTDIEPLF